MCKYRIQYWILLGVLFCSLISCSDKTKDISLYSNYAECGFDKEHIVILGRSIENYDIKPKVDLGNTINFYLYNYSGYKLFDNMRPDTYVYISSYSCYKAHFELIEISSISNIRTFETEYGKMGTVDLLNAKDVTVTPIATDHLLHYTSNDSGCFVYVKIYTNENGEYKDCLYYGDVITKSSIEYYSHTIVSDDDFKTRKFLEHN